MDPSANLVTETYRFCPRCAARVEVDRARIGDALTCRACGHRFAITPGRKKPREAGQGRGERDRAVAPKKESTDPQLPSRDAIQLAPPRGFFLSGVFGFPFRLDNLLRTLCVGATAAALLGAVRLALWSLAVESEAGDKFIRVLIFNGLLFSSLLGVYSAMLCAYPASAYGLTVLHDTAGGAEAVESWPRVLLLEDLGAAAYVAGGLLLASLPGVLLAEFRHWIGAGRLWAIAGCLPLLFPPVLLSMLESKSPLGPLQPRIWISLVFGWRGWLRFYAVSLALLGLTAALFVALWRICGPAVGAVVLGLTAGAVWMAYFRLLGRLAWFCSGRWAKESAIEQYKAGG